MADSEIRPEFVDEVVELARRAGEFTLGYFRSGTLAVRRKGDGTPVTEADVGAERLIREYIDGHHPTDTIVGEEEGTTRGESDRTWYVDPIDGTKAFTHGIPLFTNLIAVYDDTGPAVAVINMPALRETVYAARGRGCYVNGERATVSDRIDLARSYLTTSGFDYWPSHMLAAVRRAGLQLRTWGDGYGYALVATGRVEIMVDPIAAPWDLAPMPLIMSEAGGTFTDLSGNATIEGGSGVASNGRLHDQFLAALAGSQSDEQRL